MEFMQHCPNDLCTVACMAICVMMPDNAQGLTTQPTLPTITRQGFDGSHDDAVQARPRLPPHCASCQSSQPSQA